MADNQLETVPEMHLFLSLFLFFPHFLTQSMLISSVCTAACLSKGEWLPARSPLLPLGPVFFTLESNGSGKVLPFKLD